MGTTCASRQLIRGGTRGLVAAMAMSGARRVTTNLGMAGTTPPEAIVRRHAPRPLARAKRERKDAVTELAHWSYGAMCGALFGLLPRGLRTRRWIGSAYGLGIWLTFELGLAPLLGLQHTEDRGALGRFTIALDHVLYGLVVAGQIAPSPDRAGESRQPAISRQAVA